MSVTLPSGTLIEYVIDASNRRVGKKVDGVLERKWLYKDGLNPIYEEAWDSVNATWVQTRFVYASRGNVPDTLIRDGVTYRVVSDHLGSPRLVVDTATGNVAQALEYDEWGNVLSDTYVGAIPLHPFAFAGGLYDADTKLIRFGARDYDPATGRWTAKDPIRFDGDGPNLSGYTSNDPINLIDPSGQIAIVDDIIIIGAIAISAAIICQATNCGKPVADAIGAGIDAISDTFRPIFKESEEDCPRDIPSDEECRNRCLHLLPSPSGDLQSSEYRKCFRKCKGTL